MTGWGRHGEQTKDLWDVFFNTIQQPTATFADGKSCPTVQFNPFVVEIQATSKHYGTNDQLRITGGGNLHTLTPEGRSLGAPGNTPQARALVAGIWQDVVRSLMFPSQFFRFGQDYLLRMQSIKPAADAPLEHRLWWAVDTAWWCNMMLSALNVYPTWLPNALGLALDGLWAPPAHIPTLTDLFDRAEPFRSLRLGPGDVGGFPYRVPYATNPGNFNTTGLIRNAQPMVPAELARVQRFVSLRPWWTGVGTFVNFDANRAAREDASLGLVRAAAQHSFFQGQGLNTDLWQTLEGIRGSTNQQRQFATLTEKLLPAWISALTRVHYWGLVRAGVDSWKKYAAGSLTIAEYPGQPEDQQRFPYTTTEIKDLEREWRKAEQAARGFAMFSAQMQTMLSFVQAAATGSLGVSQYRALMAWKDFATFRYNVPRSWERGWEVHPLLMRLMPANTSCDCLRIDPEGGGRADCQNESLMICDSGPDVRIYGGGITGIHADQSLVRIEQTGDIRISSGADHVSPTVAAFERTVLPPAQSGSTQTSPAYGSMQEIRSKSRAPLIGAVAVLSLAVGGIIFATRKR